MRRPQCPLAAILAVAFVASPGCMPWRGPEDVRRDLTRTTGERFERDFALTVGRTGMAIARWGVRMSGEDEPWLRGIRKVEIGVYHPVGSRCGATPGLSADDFPAWAPLVSARSEDGEEVMILARETDGALRRMLVVVDEPDELVIVRVSGRLDEVIRESIRLALDGAERSDLAKPVLAEYDATH